MWSLRLRNSVLWVLHAPGRKADVIFLAMDKHRVVTSVAT
jgi:hypothetical protein